jgi:hypothetical protein
MQSAEEKIRVGAAAETAVEAALAAAGWAVINLNELAKNFRFADFLAKRGLHTAFCPGQGHND